MKESPSLHRSVLMLRIAIGIAYLWFGGLKLFPLLSPVEPLLRVAYGFLAEWGIMSLRTFIVVVGVWEVLIGIGFLVGRSLKVMTVLIVLQLAGAFSPIVLAPQEVWADFPLTLTLVGQYIAKDLILLAAVYVIWNVHREKDKAAGYLMRGG
jgi:uncharacterized membrane protein YkgB